MAPNRTRNPPSRGRGRFRNPGKGQMMLPGLEYTPSMPSTPKVPTIVGNGSQASQGRADITESDATKAAIAEAQNGDTSILLPYQPTPSINPPRPRTLAAGYDSAARTMRIQFRDGPIYEYYDVPANVWRNFKRVKSPGRMVNRVLNNYEYSRTNI